MSWMKKKWKNYAVYFVLILSFNLYYIFLMRTAQIKYLLYLDLLLSVFLMIVESAAFFKFCRKESKKAALLKENDLIYETLPELEDKAVFEHDMRILEERLERKFDENCELQDYVAKWCHEFKIPLAAGLLMTEKIKDTRLRIELKEQLERMNWQISTMLQGCRLQSPLFDLQMKPIPLRECVRASIQNNQFFLIQKKFQMDVSVNDAVVYTDEVWLTYILDQLLNNAVKYAKPEGRRYIRFWTEKADDCVELFLEDNGEGIRECDIRRIFEKGYTGNNYHNGKYKSTGMGLYMVDKIAKQLGHPIDVESQYGAYTRFRIVFRGK